MFHPRFSEHLAAGGTRRAEAIGKQAIGSLLATSAVLLAMEGRISGHNDTYWNSRETSGVQPYSIKIGDKWVSYNRLDPYGMTLGVLADFAQLAGFMEEDEKSGIVSSIMTALTNSITSKTYLRGLTDILTVLNDPEGWQTEKVLKNRLASYVPNFLNQINQAADPELKAARTALNKVMARVPGLSEAVPERRSWLTGKTLKRAPGYGPDFMSPINPFSASEEVDDTVINELDNLSKMGVDFSGAGYDIYRHKLTDAQREEWNRLMGTVKIHGITLKQRLENLFKAPEYDIDRQNMLDLDDRPDENPRIRWVRGVMRKYRKVARDELLRNDKELRDAVVASHRQSILARRGQSPSQQRAAQAAQSAAQTQGGGEALPSLLNIAR